MTKVIGRTTALVAVIALMMGGLACRAASPASGEVVARRSLYSGSTWRRWLVIRRPDGTRVEQSVRLAVWRRCTTGHRYPACAHPATKEKG